MLFFFIVTFGFIFILCFSFLITFIFRATFCSIISSSLVSSSSVFSSSDVKAAGATILAIVKSLSDIVGVISSSSFIELKCIESPNSKPVKSTINSSGIFDAGHETSTEYLTTFKIPPIFIPGQFSSFSNLTGIWIVTLVFSLTLKKSICSVFSVTG